MAYSGRDNNTIILSGIIKEDLEFVAEFKGTKIYKTVLGVLRLSGKEDYLLIYVSDRLKYFNKISIGKYIHIEGSIRSSQYRDDNKIKRTRVYVNVSDILQIYDDKPDNWYDNDVSVSGRLFRKPILRKTKTAILKNIDKEDKKADLAEVVLEVYRGYNRYDHIPIIIWGTDAKFVSNYDRGTKVSISGRFQSRNFIRHKRGSEDEYENAVSYEVSVRNIEILDKGDD